MQKIIKRDGKVVDFDQNKITEAVWKATKAAGKKDKKLAKAVSQKVAELLDVLFKGENYPNVEQVQDLVEKILIEKNEPEIAKAYILYRQKRTELREQQRKLIGATTKLDLSMNALQVLQRRYLLRNQKGEITETPERMFRRVAENIAQADANYPNANIEETAEKFYEIMSNLEFLPNSPTLMNAGTEIQQLSACFVLPVEDSMEGIFDAVKYAALIHKSGGGTGFSFSRLRPKEDRVRSTTGVSSGPISFMKVFDAATEVIKQGGKRRGANMGILRVDHPDILDFIVMKSDMVTLTNFNISVGLTNKFIEALKKNKEYDLINPRNQKPIKKLPARHVFDLILDMAWRNGDPGIIFIDTINTYNPVPHLGEIESTNPCGEQPLLPYESCNLGSINLNKVLNKDQTNIDWEKLKTTVHDSIHFLDNVIDMNNYPLPQIEQMSRGTRKVGLGLMGFGDILYQLKIPYNSKECEKIAKDIMKFIEEEVTKKSMELAENRGTFPYYKGSMFEKKGIKIRNACRTTIAPTGTIGMIAEASGGIEPNFAISYIKNVMDETELVYTNRYFEETAKERGFYSEELMNQIAQTGSIQDIEGIPEDIKKVFVTAQDITPDWHIRIQAAFQRYVDAAVSKTINFPHNATTKDIEEAYLLAYKLGCKGVTIYRYGSREAQVLNIGEVNRKEDNDEEEKEKKRQRRHKKIKSKAEMKKDGQCPECHGRLVVQEGCTSCPRCSFSACSV